jgi:mannitol-1-phosphate/altronate dehydrogenase
MISWIENNVEFRSSVVDRITPRTTKPLRKEAEGTLHLKDPAVVSTERYCELVIQEGSLPMPPWKPSVVVKDKTGVEQHWYRKYYFINVLHHVLGMVGLYQGLNFVCEAVDDACISRLAKRFHRELIESKITSAFGTDVLEEYSSTVLERMLDNKEDTLLRVTARVTEKVSNRLLDAIELCLRRAGKVIHTPILAVACWMLMFNGEDSNGDDPQLDDTAKEMFKGRFQLRVRDWLTARIIHLNGGEASEIGSIDELGRIFGDIGRAVHDLRITNLGRNRTFITELAQCLVDVRQLGIQGAIEALLARLDDNSTPQQVV